MHSIKITLIFTLLFIPFVYAEDKKFKNESEVSAIVNGGNSVSETLNAKTKNVYAPSKNIFTQTAQYTFGSSDEVVNTRNYSVGLRYDRQVSKKVSVFVSESYSGNKFTGYIYRQDTDLGAKYSFIKTDKRSLNADLGARYTIEKNTANSLGVEKKSKDTKARLYAEYVQKLKNGQYSLWAEFLPNFSESDNWQLNFGPSLELSIVNSLSLKVSYTGNYDNQIEDTVAKKYDYQVTTALLYRYE